MASYDPKQSKYLNYFNPSNPNRNETSGTEGYTQDEADDIFLKKNGGVIQSFLEVNGSLNVETNFSLPTISNVEQTINTLTATTVSNTNSINDINNQLANIGSSIDSEVINVIDNSINLLETEITDLSSVVYANTNDIISLQEQITGGGFDFGGGGGSVDSQVIDRIDNSINEINSDLETFNTYINFDRTLGFYTNLNNLDNYNQLVKNIIINQNDTTNNYRDYFLGTIVDNTQPNQENEFCIGSASGKIQLTMDKNGKLRTRNIECQGDIDADNLDITNQADFKNVESKNIVNKNDLETENLVVNELGRMNGNLIVNKKIEVLDWNNEGADSEFYTDLHLHKFLIVDDDTYLHGDLNVKGKDFTNLKDDCDANSNSISSLQTKVNNLENIDANNRLDTLEVSTNNLENVDADNRLNILEASMNDVVYGVVDGSLNVIGDMITLWDTNVGGTSKEGKAFQHKQSQYAYQADASHSILAINPENDFMFGTEFGGRVGIGIEPNLLGYKLDISGDLKIRGQIDGAIYNDWETVLNTFDGRSISNENKINQLKNRVKDIEQFLQNRLGYGYDPFPF